MKTNWIFQIKGQIRSTEPKEKRKAKCKLAAHTATKV